MNGVKEKIRAYLKENQLTQKQLAELAGVKPQVISNICNGLRIPGEDVGRRIVEATNGKITYLDLRPDLADIIEGNV